MNVQNDVESRESGEEQRSEFRKVRKKILKKKIWKVKEKLLSDTVYTNWFLIEIMMWRKELKTTNKKKGSLMYVSKIVFKMFYGKKKKWLIFSNRFFNFL